MVHERVDNGAVFGLIRLVIEREKGVVVELAPPFTPSLLIRALISLQFVGLLNVYLFRPYQEDLQLSK